MKILISAVIFTCLVFPVFSQSTGVEQFRALGDTMDRSISRSSDTLADFDSRSLDDGTLRMYSSFRKRHNDLVAALRESELRMAHFFRTNDRVSYIKEERDNYERLLTELQALKSDYDTWMRTIQ